jgi:hypothetical protein
VNVWEIALLVVTSTRNGEVFARFESFWSKVAMASYRLLAATAAIAASAREESGAGQ